MASGAYTVLADAASFAGWCQRWVQDALTGHNAPSGSAYASWVAAPNKVATSDPFSIPANVAVVFGPAVSNGGAGHVGVSNGNGLMTSVLDGGNYSGKVVQEPISQFVKDNGAALKGWYTLPGQNVTPVALPTVMAPGGGIGKSVPWDSPASGLKQGSGALSAPTESVGQGTAYGQGQGTIIANVGPWAVTLPPAPGWLRQGTFWRILFTAIGLAVAGVGLVVWLKGEEVKAMIGPALQSAVSEKGGTNAVS